MSNRAIFLDRDGTINVEKDYVHKVSEFEFIPGVIQALQKLQAMGFLLIVVTNQSGIARGYYSEEEYKELNVWMLERLEAEGIRIAAVYYCPHHPDAKVQKYRKECNCRKPKLGMYMQAVNDFEVDLELSYAIGDKLRDCSVCFSSGCKGFLISNTENAEIIESVKNKQYENISYADSLLRCAELIMESERM